MNATDLVPIASLLAEVTNQLQALLEHQMVASATEEAPKVSYRALRNKDNG